MALPAAADTAVATPTISVDKPDYAPGDTVTYTGAGFQPGESVDILAAGDTNGTLIKRSTTADDTGAFTGSFALPYTYEANYTLTATGSAGSVAMTTFTDSPKDEASLTLVSATGSYPGALTIEMLLTDTTAGGTPIAGVTVQFTIGATSKTSITDAQGHATAAFAGLPAGTYALSAQQQNSKTYQKGTYTGSVVLAPSAVTVTADPQTKVYGSADPALTYKVTSGSVASGDSFTGALSRVAGESVGTYAINQGTLALNTNYAITYVAANLTITARSMTVTADPQTKVYGDVDPTLTYKVTSGSLIGSDVLGGALARVAGENVGPHAIQQGSLSAGANYSITFVGASLTITARPITITADARAKVYGSPDPTLTYQVTSGSLAFSDAFTGVLSRTAGEDVGTYAINQGTLALSANYTLTFVGANLTITPDPITVTAKAQSKVYGASDPALTYQTSSPLASGDSFSGALGRDPGEDVGSYSINDGTLALSSNYTLTFVGANLTITARPVTVTADPQSKVYGDSEPGLTYKITSGSLVNGDFFNGALTRAAGENVGSYAIQQGTLALSSNYTLTFVGANLTITARPVTVTADPQTKVYGDSEPGLTYKITSGSLVNGDSFNGALTRAAGENVGSYAIQQGTLALSSNYTLTFVGANLTITARPVTVTADPQSKVYGDSEPGLTYKITSGSLAFSDGFTGVLTRVAGESVGIYAIQQGSLVLNANYNLTYVGADLTISPRPITVTADTQTKIYGNLDPTLTYHITSGSLAFSDAFTGALTRLAGENVGPYAIQQGTLGVNSNYSLTFLGADLTISPRPMTVTADTQTKIYGNLDPSLTYQITSGSLAFSDAFTGALTRVAGESVGTYDIEQGTLALNWNYSLTYLGADLTISPRPITVTADTQAKIYGNLDPTLTYQITSGSLAFSDAFTGALTRVAGESVGTYDIQQGSLALNSNYTLTYVGSHLTVTVRPVTVTGNAQSKVYGDPDPGLTYKITSGSLVNGDSFNGALTRAAGENVGPYAIQQGSLALNANYNLTYVGANLTITARPVTVTADSQSKVYGDSEPGLTYKITSGSLVNGDSFNGALTRAAGENVGPYAIQQGSLALTTNYVITYVPANLTITARPVTVTADTQTKVYGQSDPALTYKMTSGTLAFSDAFRGALTRLAGENVGPYAIQQGSLALNSNYNLTYVGANLTITARPITVTADAQTKVYGEPEPSLTYKLTSGSLVSGDSFTGALTRVAGENIGTYAIQQGTLSAGTNYNLTFVPGNLTITARPITVTADAQTKVYGEPEPSLTYKLTSGSLVATDAITGALTRVAGENVGSYAIQQGTLALTTNYVITYVPASLTITARPVTVTADTQTKVYGQSDPALTYKVTSGSLAFSDVFTGNLARDVGENVGSYAIKQGTVALSANYNLTYIGASLTITPATLTVTPDSKTMVLDGPVPALTYVISGFVNNDTPAVVTGAASCSTTATSASPIGVYPITCAGGTLSASNYNFAFSKAPANVSVQYAPASTTCGGAAGHVILQPITSTSVFKQGSTVPAKFRVCDANGVSIGPNGATGNGPTTKIVASFYMIGSTTGTVANVNEPVASTTPDTAFRWDSTNQQWIFNISTSNLSASTTYKYEITLNDGSTIDFQFGLK